MSCRFLVAISRLSLPYHRNSGFVLKKLIMLVDDITTNLMTGKTALQELYDVITVNSGIRALELLEKKTPDLILLDIDMPEIDGYEVLKRIKANNATFGIPVIFLTAFDNAQNEYEGLSLGAADYITKPFNEKILQKRIETHLLAEHTNNLEKLVEKKTENLSSFRVRYLVPSRSWWNSVTM